MASPVLPENTIIGILTRLPVKSIGRFKSVCKRWRHLFSTPEFLKFHRVHYSSDPKNESLIVHRSFKNSSDTSFFKIESNSINPSAIAYRGGEIVGCCNGLVCVSYGNKVIVLLNPATMLFSKVASSPLEGCGPYLYQRVSLGFGYDAEADDFKVVRVFRFKEFQNDKWVVVYRGVEVYSGNTGSWTAIGANWQFTKNLGRRSQFVVNGNPYWVEDGYVESEFLVCFDVRKLVFRLVPLKSLIDLYVVEDPQFVEWKGSLGALVTTKRRRVAKSLDVWVFDDEQIWRKSHSFQAPDVVDVERFLECSKSGKVLGKRSNGKLSVFDTKTGFVNVLDNGDDRQHKRVKIFPYTESLAYIEGMKKV